MVTRIGGNRKRTRSILSVPKSMKGKLSLSTFFRSFKVGDHVVFKAAPSVHSGQYGRRFHGRTGVIVAIHKSMCEVSVKDKNKRKTVLVSPVHLQRV